MPKNKSVSRIPIFFILALSILGSIGYVGYRSLLQPSDIFVIEESPVTYGDTVVTGSLRKDAPVGVNGTYLLVLSDGRPIVLDAQGLDGLLGADVTVTGVLSPALDTSSSMTMTVNTITIAN